MRWTVLSVAYPLAPVRPDAVGGAEQILSQLDRALVKAGHRSLVVAAEASRVAGELVPVAAPSGPLDQAAMETARRHVADAVNGAILRYPVDLVHMHGVDFHHYLPAPGPPVLATLHLPAQLYPERALMQLGPRCWLNAVSASQHRTFGHNPRLLPPIENGVDMGAEPSPRAKRNFALMLARICPEKGVHLAIEAAKLASLPLLIGGEVFPYPDHLAYFRREVQPRLDRRRRFLGPVGGARKRRLLGSARCLLAPSCIAETSSLVGREAIATGTPVVAFKAGALVETIEHGRTGFLVDDVAGMAAAMHQVHSLCPAYCREAARRRFSLERMIEAYFSAYRFILDASMGRRLTAGAA